MQENYNLPSSETQKTKARMWRAIPHKGNLVDKLLYVLPMTHAGEMPHQQVIPGQAAASLPCITPCGADPHQCAYWATQ